MKEVRHGERVKNASLPFTTSTLQQEASKVLNFSTQKTMRLAQQLYEGVDIKGEGTVGLITYLRTDSTRVSEEAEAQAAQFIDAHYGEKYKAAANTEKKNGQKIQDAHEAIRPSDITRSPILVKESLSRDQFRLYQLFETLHREPHGECSLRDYPGKDSGRGLQFPCVRFPSLLRRLHVRLCG